MYGLVNKAVEELVVSKFGKDAWTKIKDKAGVKDASFLAMNSYHDDVTYKLVGAACEVLSLKPEQVLEVFGEFWIPYAAKSGYANMLKMAGATMPEFFGNLDKMHVQIGKMFPQLKPPSFQVSDAKPGSMVVHYRSSRAGLAPFVVGLIKGAGVYFNHKVTVTQTMRKGAGGDHDAFQVQYR